jgi:hypothetical protein
VNVYIWSPAPGSVPPNYHTIWGWVKESRGGEYKNACMEAAIHTVAPVMLFSGLVVSLRMYETLPSKRGKLEPQRTISVTPSVHPG